MLVPVPLFTPTAEFPPRLPPAQSDPEERAYYKMEGVPYIPPYRPTLDADKLPLWITPFGCGLSFALQLGCWRVVEAPPGDPRYTLPAIIRRIRQVQPGVDIRMLARVFKFSIEEI